jgi:hypothetical protein
MLTENLNLLRFDHDSTYMDGVVSLFESEFFGLTWLETHGVHAHILPSGYEEPRTNFSGDDDP